MIQANYDQLVDRISKLSAIERKEIERRIEAKIAKLSGLISKEGAAKVVAAELGISFDKQKYNISDLLTGMRKISITAKIISIFPIRTYMRGGSESKVASMIVGDETGNIRTVLWDTNHIAMIENGTIKTDSVVEIKNADVRGTTVKELHLGSFSELRISDKKIEKVNMNISSPDIKKISELNINENARVKAAILQIFQPKFFNVCPECNMKVSFENNNYICHKHGNVLPKERILFNMVIDDGSDNINAIAFNEVIEKIFNIPPSNLKDTDTFINKKSEILAKEFFLTGRLRKNALFNKAEFIIQDIAEVFPEDIIKELSKN